MSELYEESLRRVQEGEVVKGRIVSITKDFVMVDIGYKSEGQIPIAEFTTPDGEITAQVGDQVEALLEGSETEEGPLMLSKNKASRIKVWEEISYAYHNDATVEGTIVAKVKGGLSVDLGGILAFLPGSQVDLMPVRHTDHLIGQTTTFNVLKFNRKRRNVVLSRRSLLEKVKGDAKATLLSTLEEGKVVDGVIKNITDYGVFVDLGGLDGLLHITDLSYGRIRHPADLFKVGDTIAVKVLSFDRDKERISLGLKQLAPDPWTTVAENFPIGSRVTGKVVSLTDYGSFIELEAGVEGLIHISEMSWTRKVRHPNQILTVGDIVEVVVLELDPQRKRISLPQTGGAQPLGSHRREIPGGLGDRRKNQEHHRLRHLHRHRRGHRRAGAHLRHLLDQALQAPLGALQEGADRAGQGPLHRQGKRALLPVHQGAQPQPLAVHRNALPGEQPGHRHHHQHHRLRLLRGGGGGHRGAGAHLGVEQEQRQDGRPQGGGSDPGQGHSLLAQDRRIGLSIRRLETDEEQRNYRDYMKSSTEATSNLGDHPPGNPGAGPQRRGGLQVKTAALRRFLVTGLVGAAGAVLLCAWPAARARADWDPLDFFGEKVGVVEVTGLITKATPSWRISRNSGKTGASRPSSCASTPRGARWDPPRRSWRRSTRPRR